MEGRGSTLYSDSKTYDLVQVCSISSAIELEIALSHKSMATHERKHFWTHFLNTLRPKQDGRHFTDDTLKCIFLNENVTISINISLKFVPKGRIHNITLLVQSMAWRRPGDKPLFEPMMVRLPTHTCVTRPQ